MKLRSLLCLALLACTAACNDKGSEAKEVLEKKDAAKKTRRRVVFNSPHREPHQSLDFYGLPFAISRKEASEVLLFRGEPVMEVMSPLYFDISAPALSKSETCIAMIVSESLSRELPAGKYSTAHLTDYKGVLFSRRKGDRWVQDASLAFSPLPKDYRRIREIGAVTDDAQRVLAEFDRIRAVANSEEDKRIWSEWEEMNLDGTVVRTGLSIGN
jgi:hypothetical protein